MKSIEQLLQLKENPYYQLSPEEKARLDVFLFEKQVQQSQPKKNGKDSEKNIPATVLNKNVVGKETGKIPVVDNVAQIDSQEVVL